MRVAKRDEEQAAAIGGDGPRRKECRETVFEGPNISEEKFALATFSECPMLHSVP
jgi:hypothetical protein